MPVYCIRFDPEVLWPGNTEKNFTFYADLFEAYLDPVVAS
jgi:nitrile hydratase